MNLASQIQFEVFAKQCYERSIFFDLKVLYSPLWDRKKVLWLCERKCAWTIYNNSDSE